MYRCHAILTKTRRDLAANVAVCLRTLAQLSKPSRQKAPIRCPASTCIHRQRPQRAAKDRTATAENTRLCRYTPRATKNFPRTCQNTNTHIYDICIYIYTHTTDTYTDTQTQRHTDTQIHIRTSGKARAPLSAHNGGTSLRWHLSEVAHTNTRAAQALQASSSVKLSQTDMCRIVFCVFCNIPARSLSLSTAMPHSMPIYMNMTRMKTDEQTNRHCVWQRIIDSQ